VGINHAQVWMGSPPYVPTDRGNNARANGHRYERKVVHYLDRECIGWFMPALWFRYTCGRFHRWRYCQVDGLWLQPTRKLAVVVEVKLRHTPDAWTQVRKLYEPVVKHILGPTWDYTALEVVNHYDPSTKFPEKLYFLDNLNKITPSKFHVHILREGFLNEYRRVS